MKSQTYKLAVEERDRLRILLDKGKGEYGKASYVRDATWDGWTHSFYTLQILLDKVDSQATIFTFK